jgi:hypothetical protein
MPAFTGFRETDFSTNVRGTHWRHRRALGSDLRRGLRGVFGNAYETWGAPGANLMHIARPDAYRFPPRQPQAHLFVSASPEGLRWGWRLPTAGRHWQRFRARLKGDPALLTLLGYLLYAYPLTLTEMSTNLGGALGGCWRVEEAELIWFEARTLPSPVILQDIPFRILDLPARGDRMLALYAETGPANAVAWGKHAADRLLPILLALVPLYEMCVSG